MKKTAIIVKPATTPLTSIASALGQALVIVGLTALTVAPGAISFHFTLDAQVASKREEPRPPAQMLATGKWDSLMYTRPEWCGPILTRECETLPVGVEK